MLNSRFGQLTGEEAHFKSNEHALLSSHGSQDVKLQGPGFIAGIADRHAPKCTMSRLVDGRSQR